MQNMRNFQRAPSFTEGFGGGGGNPWKNLPSRSSSGSPSMPSNQNIPSLGGAAALGYFMSQANGLFGLFQQRVVRPLMDPSYWYESPQQIAAGWVQCPTPTCGGQGAYWRWLSTSTCTPLAACPADPKSAYVASGTYHASRRGLLIAVDFPTPGTNVQVREQWIRPAAGHPNFNVGPYIDGVTVPAPDPWFQPYSPPYAEPDPFLPLPEVAPIPQWRPVGVPVPVHWPVAPPAQWPGVSPRPRPIKWPIGVPIEVPIVTPGPSAPPRPRPRPNPRPDPTPTPRPSGVRVPATRIELRPDGSSRTRPDKHRKRRDGRKKMQMPAWMFAALKLYHGATEVNDFIESLADAMPKETGCKKLPGFQRAACVISNLDKVDWGQAALNVIKNEIEDQLVGRGVGKLGNASQQARGMGYHAPNTTQSTGYVRSATKMINF